MNKNRLSVLLVTFFILVGETTYADSSNGFNLVRIKDIRLVKKISGGTQIFDVSEDGIDNASYILSFITKKECGEPVVNLLDAGRNPYETEQTNTYKSGKNTAWQIKSDIVGARSPVFYSITLSGDEKYCKKIEGTMPELKLSLIPSDDQDKNRKIAIKNVTSQPIEITKIVMEKNSNPNAINAEFNGKPILTAIASRAISVPAKGQVYIVLKPGAICTADEVTDEFRLKMEYKIGNEISKDTFGMIVEYSCDRVSREPLPIEATSTVELKETKYKFKPQMLQGGTRTAEFLVKNSSDKEASLIIGGFKQPIYRSLHLSLADENEGKTNCGDKLGAGESCVIRLVAHPTEVEEINQELRIVSDALKQDIIVGLNINVIEAPPSPLQITPISQDYKTGIELPGSIANVICPNGKMVNIPRNYDGTDFVMCNSLDSIFNNYNYYSEIDFAQKSQAPTNTSHTSAESRYEMARSLMAQSQPMCLNPAKPEPMCLNANTPKRLEYLLENKSGEVLEVVSGEIPHSSYSSDPVFKIAFATQCKDLRPHNTCKMWIGFMPEKGMSTSEKAGNVYKILNVDIRKKRKSWWEWSHGKLESGSKIPILINKIQK